jgi:hypothetical protein
MDDLPRALFQPMMFHVEHCGITGDARQARQSSPVKSLR